MLYSKVDDKDSQDTGYDSGSWRITSEYSESGRSVDGPNGSGANGKEGKRLKDVLLILNC